MWGVLILSPFIIDFLTLFLFPRVLSIFSLSFRINKVRWRLCCIFECVIHSIIICCTTPTKLDHICKLSKAIYGLNQAPRAWFDSLKTTLLKWGFQSIKSDSSIFLLKGKNHMTFLLIYVDDIIVTGNSNKFLQAFIKQLNNVFSLKYLGRLHYFLSI